MAFLPTNISEEILLKPKSQNWSWVWYVVVIKTKGNRRRCSLECDGSKTAESISEGLSGFSDRSWHWSVTGPRSCQSPSFSIATVLMSSFFLDLLVGCSSIWRCAYEHFSPNWQPLLVLYKQAFWRVPPFTKMSYCKFLWGNPCKAIETFYQWDFGFTTLFFHPAAWKNSEMYLTVIFPRLLISWRKLQLSPFTHCPLVSHCQQSPRILCTRCFVPWFLTTAFLLIISILAPKFFFQMSCSIPLFTMVFNLWWSGPNFFWWISRSYNSNTVLSFSDSRILYFISSGGIFVIDNKIPSHFESNSWISSFRRLIVNRSAWFSTESWAPVTRK